MLAFPGVVVVWSGDRTCLETHPIPLTPMGLTFGRENLVAETTDDRISRQHVRFTIEGGTLVVTDLGSRNGTYVNGEALVDLQGKFAFPTVVRAGRTLVAAVSDLRRYENAAITRRDGDVIGATLERAYREIDDAAMCEENVIIEAAPSIGKQLALRYCKAIGGDHLVFEPPTEALESFLAETRPRTVVLMLTTAALGMADMATVSTWLETDVRFVIVMWPKTTPLSSMEERSYDRLRSRVIEVSNPRFDELPTVVEDIVRAASPAARMHATVVEVMLLRSRQYDEGWLLARFHEAVNRWSSLGAETLRAADVAQDLEPTRSHQDCLVGDMPRSRRRRSR